MERQITAQRRGQMYKPSKECTSKQRGKNEYGPAHMKGTWKSSLKGSCV